MLDISRTFILKGHAKDDKVPSTDRQNKKACRSWDAI